MGTDAAIDIAARISGATTDIASRMTGAIRDAARKTGAGFEYLLNTALRESNLNPNAKARTSSATGLFQFIDQTWLGTMKQSGASLGYGQYANAITKTSSGRYTVSDPTMRQQILALRKDPTANSLMAGAFANANAKVLTDRLGRKPTDGELYIAHFLGASGASRLITAAEARPGTKAADLFPRAAAANRSIFYDQNGGARSLKQVYAGLITKHDMIGATKLAAATPTDVVKPVAAPSAATSAVSATVPVALTNLFSDPPPVAAPASAAPAASPAAVAAVADATASATVSTSAAVPNVAALSLAGETPQGPLFQSLYQPDQRSAVAPIVRELWGVRHAAAAETASAIAPASVVPGGSDLKINAPLDLFQFLRPNLRRPA
jgi:hypothetical protein